MLWLTLEILQLIKLFSLRSNTGMFGNQALQLKQPNISVIQSLNGVDNVLGGWKYADLSIWTLR